MINLDGSHGGLWSQKHGKCRPDASYCRFDGTQSENLDGGSSGPHDPVTKARVALGSATLVGLLK